MWRSWKDSVTLPAAPVPIKCRLKSTEVLLTQSSMAVQGRQLEVLA